eukprot:14081939-Alexandrium_andersonii.AAC.1
MDYCFLAQDGSGASLTVLVIKDRDSRAILAHPVLRKGRLRDDSVGQAVASIRRRGHRRWILLRTDNEPALVDLRQAVAERLGVQTVLESPPAYAPQPNSSFENAARQLQGLIRALMLALLGRIQGGGP